MIKDKLQIILITYNRAKNLRETLEQLLAENSPIKNFDITILNNTSTDCTDEIILEYQNKFPNIKHIRNPINVGGNANICKAYELAATCGKEYAWILCDDDVYDFSNWQEVEKCIEEKQDIICVCDYGMPHKKDKKNKAYQIFQLAFVPACIFKTSNIDDNVIFNMYESTFTVFQQLALTISVINEGKEVYVLSKPIVFNGMHFENKRENRSFTKGAKKVAITERKQAITWILGFSNIITLIKDKKLKQECLEVSIPYVDIYASWKNFYRSMDKKYFNRQYFNYFYEIYKNLKIKRKIQFWIYKLTSFIPFAKDIPAWIKSAIIYFNVIIHNSKCRN